MNKKLIIGFIVFIIVLFIIMFINGLNKRLYTKYYFGDTGVSVTVYNKFKSKDDERKNTDVSLYNSELETYVVGRKLPDSFWKSNDMELVCDEYIRTISAMYYDREIANVSFDTITINGVEVGKVDMTVRQEHTSNKATTLIFPEGYDNLIIEIYGNEDKLKDTNEIYKIVKNVKIEK